MEATKVRKLKVPQPILDIDKRLKEDYQKRDPEHSRGLESRRRKLQRVPRAAPRVWISAIQTRKLKTKILRGGVAFVQSRWTWKRVSARLGHGLGESRPSMSQVEAI